MEASSSRAMASTSIAGAVLGAVEAGSGAATAAPPHPDSSAMTAMPTSPLIRMPYTVVAASRKRQSPYREESPMTVGRGLFVAGVDESDGTTPVEARLALAGLLTPNGELGVTPGVISGGAVAGRSTAPTWAYTVAAGHFVLTRGATDGAVLIATSGTTNTPTVSAAPVTGSRWDLIWVRQRDVENADPDSNSVLGVTSGTSSGSPSKPYGDVPAGALVLAEAQVSAGASNTADPLVVITPVAPRVASRGGIIPVSSATQRDLLNGVGTATDPVYVDLNGVLQRGVGSVWTSLPASTSAALTITGGYQNVSAGEAVTVTRVGDWVDLTGRIRNTNAIVSPGVQAFQQYGFATVPVGFRPA